MTLFSCTIKLNICQLRWLHIIYNLLVSHFVRRSFFLYQLYGTDFFCLFNPLPRVKRMPHYVGVNNADIHSVESVGDLLQNLSLSNINHFLVAVQISTIASNTGPIPFVFIVSFFFPEYALKICHWPLDNHNKLISSSVRRD